MAESTNISCENPDCKVSESGKCLEGISPLTTCSHFGKPTRESATELTDTATNSVSTGLPLTPGHVLDSGSANKLMQSKSTRLIATIGPNDAGKTTFIATLYEMFLRGPFAGHQFSGSQTLFSFEQQCHLARASCRRSIPRMERSALGPAHYFHLSLKNSAPEENIELLLADRSGEDYKAVIDNLDIASDFIEIRRADYVNVLVDGSRLANSQERHDAISKIRMILQGMVESGSLTKGHRIGIILSKFDMVQKSEHKQRALDDFNRLATQIKTLYADKLSSIEVFNLAACPHDSDLQPGYGLEQLLTSWLLPIEYQPIVKSDDQFPKRIFARLRENVGD